MCAIVDNDVRHEVFGDRNTQTEAGRFFFEWLEANSKLVVGGELLIELSSYSKFVTWFQQAQLSGKTRLIDRQSVDREAGILQNRGVCMSNDSHVLALAIVSDVRLLFTNDYNLQQDFRDPAIVNTPRGQIYETNRTREVSAIHKRLLYPRDRRVLCRECR